MPDLPDLPDRSAAPISLPGRVVLFDYGEVVSLALDPDRAAELERLADVPADSFWAAYWDLRLALDAGDLSAERYWAEVGARCGASWSLAARTCLWSADLRGWLRIDPAVVEVLERLAAGGTRLALLSNAGADYGSAFRHGPLGRLFEAVFVSGELRMVKPAAAVYRHVADALGVDPSAVVFVDNKAENADGARAVGMTGHHFVGVADLTAFLAGLAA